MEFVCHSYVNCMYSYVTHMSFECNFYLSYVTPICMSIMCVVVCHSYVTCMYSYVIRMSHVCTRMLFVCYSYVTRMYSYVTRMSCHRMSRMYSYVTRMYSYVTRMSLACGLTMNPEYHISM